MRTSPCFYLSCSWRNALWLNAMHCRKKCVKCNALGSKEMNSRIRRPLYISLKSWLCCCSLPTVAPQQKRRMIANDPLKVVSNTQSTWLSGKLKPAELLVNSRISLSYRVQMTQTISLIGWIFFLLKLWLDQGLTSCHIKINSRNAP